MTLLRRGTAICAGLILTTALAIAILGPLLAEHLVSSPATRTVTSPYASAADHPLLGADYLGRDVVARLLAGGWALVVIPIVAVVLAEACGALIGVWLAQAPRLRQVPRYVLDVILVVPPAVSLLIVLTASGTNPLGMILLVLTISLPFVSRYFQSLAAPLVSAGFVEAARARGDSTTRIVVTEILPNLIVPIVSDIGLRFVGAVYLVATASFLGASALGDDPNWAAMVQHNSAGLSLNVWAVAAPAIMIAAVTIPANLLADMYLERRQ
ncbi:ABC transporter permease [Rhodococcus sp. NPDC058521]|uniref:ABC transporter permease n=1 Tax=Rhodococcus sp. NPDC058521 TaxID=3346536 RepID=UPI00364F1E02